jgi:acyl-CoA thioester hydrolase
MQSSSTFRVYYEDTDAGGVVYHSNYLNFMERGRTDFLLNHQIKQTTLAQQNILFVVHKIDITYHSPAKFEDLIRVETKIAKTSKTRIFFEQEIWVDDNLKVQATVVVACITADNFKPCAIPEGIFECFTL